MAYRDNKQQRMQMEMDSVSLRKNKDVSEARIAELQSRDASTPHARGVGVAGNAATMAASPIGKLFSGGSSQGMSSKLSAAQSITGGGGGETTSTSGGALGGAAKGAAAGAAFGPYGALAGGAIGAITGGLKAKSAKRKALGKIEAEKQKQLGQIAADKGVRLNEALSGLANNMGSTLNLVGR